MTKGGNRISYSGLARPLPAANCGDSDCTSCVLPVEGGAVVFLAVPGALLVLAAVSGNVSTLLIRI